MVMDWVPVLRISIAFLMLLMASWSDWKSRVASDWYWIILGVFGVLFLGIDLYLEGGEPAQYIFLFPIAFIFLDIFWNRPQIFGNGVHVPSLVLYLMAFSTIGTLAVEYWDSFYFWEFLTIPVLIGVIVLLYYLGLVKGGADAKCLIALAVVFPLYPAFGQFPLIDIPVETAQLMFPFAFLVLFNAALLMLALPVIFLGLNIRNGDMEFPVMFFGYRKSLREAEKDEVWILDRIEGGVRETELFPTGYDEEEAIEQLRKEDIEEVWVTPKVPFLIPLAISLIISSVIGNLLFLFMG